MNGTVVDSSLVAKWVLLEPDTPKAKQIGATATSGTPLVVLDLAYVEVTNAIWSRHRRKLITALEAESALDALRKSPVQVERAIDILESALQLAIKYDRSIYDALFVALVKRTGLPGVTADEPLYNAVHVDFPM